MDRRKFFGVTSQLALVAAIPLGLVGAAFSAPSQPAPQGVWSTDLTLERNSSGVLDWSVQTDLMDQSLAGSAERFMPRRQSLYPF